MLYIGSSVSEKCRSTLKKLNIAFTVMPDNPALPSPLCSHPDMSAIDICGRLFSAMEMARFFGCCDTRESFGNKYPRDVLFNGFTICNRLFCNEKSFSKAVIEFAKENCIKTVNVNQGYAKCSCVVLGNAGIITADRSIANAAKDICNVLLISEGGILLPPYDYGFIGGASFVLGSAVYFFGDIGKHKDCKEIIDFISECGFTAISLSDEPLSDCGGAIWKND